VSTAAPGPALSTLRSSVRPFGSREEAGGRHVTLDEQNEWLESDGLGGYASGTVTGVRTRRYHALLVVARRPPTGRVVLVSAVDASIETRAGRFALSSHRYLPDVLHPDGVKRLVGFAAEPWPTWTFELEDGTRIAHELLMVRGQPLVLLFWRLLEGHGDVSLTVRPFLSGRHHRLLHADQALSEPVATIAESRVTWRSPELPGVLAISNGLYEHAPERFRQFCYERELARGVDHVEDLASPGHFTWGLSSAEACLALSSEDIDRSWLATGTGPPASLFTNRAQERRRRAAFPGPLHRAAERYVVTRGAGKSVIAGYPWLTDRGRESCIALRGLCLATGRFEDARDVLLVLANSLEDGMLPERFLDAEGDAEFGAVDASLWFVVAVHDLLRRRGGRDATSAADQHLLWEAVNEILGRYTAGTSKGIRLDMDGLLLVQDPCRAKTWLDQAHPTEATRPRRGKPVEIQALWLNALWAARSRWPHWQEPFERGLLFFRERFWNHAEGFLYDVIDADLAPGRADPRLRPNQVLAAGGLPFSLLQPGRARRVIDAVELQLLTPYGLRTLDPTETGYVAEWMGESVTAKGVHARGAAWPWLLGPFVEAWVRVRGGTAAARAEARRRFLSPLLDALPRGGIGHLSEIADGGPPHTLRGCPFYSPSLGELLRLDLEVLS